MLGVLWQRDKRQGPSAWRLYLLPITALMILDFVPRFFQGDSLSYLSTSIGGWIPPDRSWLFGLGVNFLLRHTHGLSAFLFIQIGVLIVIIEGMRHLFQDMPNGLRGWVAVGFMIAADPLIELYTRFYLTDFLAMACFLAVVAAVVYAAGAEARLGRLIASLLIIMAGTLGAIFLRVAYAPIVLMCLAIAVVLLYRRLVTRQAVVLAIAALAPFLAVGAVAGANTLIFAQRFPHEIFVTKLSGVFLAGVFAPALTEVDFRHAGIPITDQEFKALDLGNYGKRVTQVWGTKHDDLQQLIKDNLHVTGDYHANIDQAASRLVKSAAHRAPFSLIKVYLMSAVAYGEPAQWYRQVPGEMAIDIPLPDYFLQLVNKYSVLKITSRTSEIRSLLIREYEAVAGFYPLQLLLGLAAGLFLVIRHGPKPEFAVPFAALIADLVAAPLYSNYVIARYILAAVVLSYVLIFLAAAAGFARSRAG